MYCNFSGRGATHHPAWRCAATLPFLFLLLTSCREQIPSPSEPGPVDLRFILPLNSYCSYDNWLLAPDGHRIRPSRYRTSWRVIDTNAVAFDSGAVAIVVDSTFATSVGGTDSLRHTELRYFHTSANGDFFEFGFIARLRRQRDTIQIDPVWDRLLSPSSGTNSLWVVEANDSAAGNVYGVFYPQLENVEDSINGVSMGVLAHHVEFTGVNLTLAVWVGGTPPAFLRMWDQSDVPFNRVFQELRVRRTQ